MVKLRRKRLLLFLFPAALIITVGGCNQARNQDSTLHIMAASSLANAFTALKTSYMARHPGRQVRISLAGSQTLRLQIEQGAEVDVFASANPEHMTVLKRSGHVPRSRVFAHNELVIVLPQGRPGGLGTFHDLPMVGRIVLGAPQVPAGAYARKFLDKVDAQHTPGFRKRVLARVVSQELNVRLVLTRVILGQADAGIVYRSDVRNRPLRVLPIPKKYNVRAQYHMGVPHAAPNPGGGKSWIAFVLSPGGQSILKEHGFQAP